MFSYNHSHIFLRYFFATLMLLSILVVSQSTRANPQNPDAESLIAGVYLDTGTNLIWMKITDKSKKYKYQEAESYCANLTKLSHEQFQWRIPTFEQLKTLQKKRPPGWKLDSMWSSTLFPGSTSTRYTVDLNRGTEGNSFDLAEQYTTCVARSGFDAVSGNYFDDYNGLIWTKIERKGYTAAKANDLCQSLNQMSNSSGKWTLPTVAQLHNFYVDVVKVNQQGFKDFKWELSKTWATNGSAAPNVKLYLDKGTEETNSNGITNVTCVASVFDAQENYVDDTDNLIWSKTAVPSLTFDKANEVCQQKNKDANSPKWQLPTLEQLQNLNKNLDENQHRWGPDKEALLRAGWVINTVWSSSKDPRSGDHLGINMKNGASTSTSYGTSLYVTCVKPLKWDVAKQFTDQKTGLSWLAITPKPYTANEGESYCSSALPKGKWALPNKEQFIAMAANLKENEAKKRGVTLQILQEAGWTLGTTMFQDGYSYRFINLLNPSETGQLMVRGITPRDDYQRRYVTCVRKDLNPATQ